MVAKVRGAEPYVPLDTSIPSLKTAVQDCRGCDLYRDATQAVLGEGPDAGVEMMMVGEQPGDKEDLAGRPFVGPAGHMLDKALEDLGIARDKVYITNAVKHFRWAPKGKRRIHQTPRASEIRACQPWLEAEVDTLEPKLIVALGAVAVSSLLGTSAKVTTHRGQVVEGAYGPCLVTTHPSSIIRVEDADERAAAYSLFLSDLRAGLSYLQRVA
jgi:DNA polymerase